MARPDFRRAMTVKEQYWKYSLYTLILGLGTIIFIELIPFMGGILGAVTIYILLRGQMRYLTERRHWRPSLAATLLLFESALLFLIPISLIVWLLINKIQSLTLDPASLIRSVEQFASTIEAKTGYALLDRSNLNSVLALLPRIGQWLMKNIASFAINMIVLLFVLYFMLCSGHKMENYFREILPFNRINTDTVMREIRLIVRSNAIGIPLLAIIQGAVAYGGYVLFGVPSPVFWGILTCFATIIPLLGTALIWAPLAIYLGIMGQWGHAIGLTVYALLVVSHVDNLVRFVLQKKLADIHPLVTVFGVVIGLSLFGFMGVIFGPLLLSLFLMCVDLFKTKYLQSRRHIPPPDE